jgi:hypothetical protein
MKLNPALAAALVGLGIQAAHAASEGGDTWSSVAALSHARPASVVVATTASLFGMAPVAESAYGSPAAPEGADRVVRLAPGMRSIDAAWGERIVFVTADPQGRPRSFAWRFDVSPMQTHIDLNEVAPSDFPAQGIRVFVAARPEYRGG